MSRRSPLPTSPRWRRGRAGLLLLVALAAMTVAAPSRADDDEKRERASRSFGEAKAAFSLHKYTAAATAFEEAARLVPHATTWLDAAAAWEAAGEPDRAAEDCDRAIALGADESVSTDAARRLERLLPKIGTLALRGRSTSLVRVDGSDPVPLPAVRRVAAGHHRLIVTEGSSGERRIVEVDAAAGSVHTIELDAPPAPPSPPGPPPAPSPVTTRPAAPSSGPPLTTWIAFGVGTAAAVGAGVFGGLTLGAKSSYEATPTQDSLDTFKTDRLMTNVLAGAALVAVAVGLVVWAVAPSSGRAASTRPGALAF